MWQRGPHLGPQRLGFEGYRPPSDLQVLKQVGKLSEGKDYIRTRVSKGLEPCLLSLGRQAR